MKNKKVFIARLGFISLITTCVGIVETSTPTLGKEDLKLSLGEFVSLALNPSDDDKVLGNKVKAMIFAAGEAYSWMNLEITDRKQSAIYCPPEKLSITGEQYVRALYDFVDKRPAIESEDFRSWPYILLKALEEVFPCKTQM